MIERLTAHQFRCLQSVELSIPSEGAAVVGDNGAGKTSILEAIYYLARGRSFRQARSERLIQFERDAFQLTAGVRWRQRAHQVGVSLSRSAGARIRIDGSDQKSLAVVGTEVAVQVLEPEVHRLISEGPDARRGFLDFGVFHVEPGYLSAWRRYRQALKQRNAALKKSVSDDQLSAWDAEMVAVAETVDGYRRGYANLIQEPLNRLAKALSLPAVAVSYRPGWQEGAQFAEALASSRLNDRERQTTSVGPHRADLAIRWAGRMARPTVSRGQQKLLASALILAQTLLVANLKQESTILLLDDPGAELDRKALERLMAVIAEMPGQHIMTALDESHLPQQHKGAVFHVEQGMIRTP
ncbi:MAG: DNA replication/repair protein RecF [Pseudomonadota bacterium]